MLACLLGRTPLASGHLYPAAVGGPNALRLIQWKDTDELACLEEVVHETGLGPIWARGGAWRLFEKHQFVRQACSGSICCY